MIKERFGKQLDRWIHLAFPFLFQRAVNPNLLTLVGTLVSVGAGVAFAFGAFVPAGLLLLAGGFFDLVDGVVARHFGRSTAFGAFLDSTMDRLVDMVVFFGVVVHYGVAGETGIVVLAGVVLVASVMTSYAKARAELFVAHVPGGLLERGERIGLLATGAILGWMVPILWILAIGTTLTAVQRFAVAYQQMHESEIEVLNTGADGASGVS